MKKLKTILTYFILPLAIVFLTYLVVESIMTPVRFEKEYKHRQSIAIERLKGIRTLQVAYKAETGRFASTLDSLIDFYNNGEITIIRQIGSMDDSLAVAQNRVRRDSIRIAVRDTLIKNIPVVDSLKTIPYSNGELIMMQSVIRSVSGVEVPLFEASIPYDYLLRGLDRQLIVNLKAAREDLGRYAGLRVGSIDSPNNNAGNWE